MQGVTAAQSLSLIVVQFHAKIRIADFLRLLEGVGLTGTWGWTFATNELVWSPGYFRLLGLDPSTTRASYDLYLSLVHPDDRHEIETSAQVMQEGSLRDRTVRVIRPDGSMRILLGRSEIFVSDDGRPRAAAGIVLDVTDREQLARSVRAEEQRKRALIDHIRTLSAASVAGPDADGEAALVTMRSSPEAVLEEVMRVFAPRPAGQEAEDAPMTGFGAALERRLDGYFTAARDEPASPRTGAVAPSPRRDLGACIEGHHLRAARALLDWSMADLAKASGLSLSTVRRLDEGIEGPASRSRRAAIAALQEAGIVFSLLDSTIVVGRA
ncbi:PAS domain-containing protein [Methylobacterium isbiliense]|uniref:PAS domain-containing protein n=1 Tax=Methylobacterium isbiliense TaxID=315478 RepID=UPI0025B56F56|nr:PAS domain-containing protein [Methylobacterium isbiliense]MDN3626410.1 PAS domain-containing protein [Methylobacterium isbiliense]